jgi:metallophosphoesterase superfamily enzyme
MQIEIRGNHFLLLTQRAIFWQETQTLLIGDIHLGKITHFRKEGIAVPPNAIENNFKRLNELVQNTGATRIIFLGDYFMPNTMQNGSFLKTGAQSIITLKC